VVGVGIGSVLGSMSVTRGIHHAMPRLENLHMDRWMETQNCPKCWTRLQMSSYGSTSSPMRRFKVAISRQTEKWDEPRDRHRSVRLLKYGLKESRGMTSEQTQIDYSKIHRKADRRRLSRIRHGHPCHIAHAGRVIGVCKLLPQKARMCISPCPHEAPPSNSPSRTRATA
jgi:hypothetical protein